MKEKINNTEQSLELAMLFSIWAIGLVSREKLISRGEGLMIAGINIAILS